MARNSSTTAAKADNAPATGKAASTGTAPATQAAAGSQTEAERAKVAETEAAERAKVAEEAKGAADEQRQDVEAGGTGELSEEAATLAKRHSVSDPKAAPVDYSVQTARKPAHRTLNPEEVSADAMPRSPIAVLPYGSEPGSFDPATGVAPVKPDPAHAADVHGDDLDADTDRGASAALREAQNQ